MIYFLHAPEVGRIKIGFSEDCQQRIAALLGGSPTALTLLVAVDGSMREERKLHRAFEADHYRGEWFAASQPLVELCRELAALPHPERHPRLTRFIEDDEARREANTLAFAKKEDQETLRRCTQAFIEKYGRPATVSIADVSVTSVGLWARGEVTIGGRNLARLLAHDLDPFRPFFSFKLDRRNEVPRPRKMFLPEIDGAIRALTALKVRAERVRAA